MINVTQGKINRKEFENRHFYFVEDMYYPGVTSILDEAGPVGSGLKQFFLNHNASEAETIREEAADFGSRMHGLYEELLKGTELDLTSESLKGIKHLVSFKEWFKDFKPHDFKTELMIYSKKYRYAGTLDFVCTHQGKRWIVDFKTSSNIYFNHEVQLAAYKQAYEEMTGEKIDHIGVLRTGSKHKAGYEFKEIERPFADFLNIYNTYIALHDGKLPGIPVDLLKKHPSKIKL